MRLVLASTSPRRRELLDAAGIAFDVHAVDVDERRESGETPEAYAERLARLKASAGAREKRRPERASNYMECAARQQGRAAAFKNARGHVDHQCLRARSFLPF